jgi:hypothetical protein
VEIWSRVPARIQSPEILRHRGAAGVGAAGPGGRVLGGWGGAPAFAGRHELFGWRRDARSQSENGAGKGGMAFTPVIVEAAPCADVPISPARPGGSPSIEIVIGAATVRIAPGIGGTPYFSRLPLLQQCNVLPKSSRS